MTFTLITYAAITRCTFKTFDTINTAQKNSVNPYFSIENNARNTSTYKRNSYVSNTCFHVNIKHFLHLFNFTGLFDLFYSHIKRSLHNTISMPSQGLQVKANYFDTFLSNHDYKILKISYYSCNAIPNFFSLFLCILVLIILLYINYFSENEFKPKSVETNFFSFLFISFFAQTFQKYINANETLLIYNEKDFWSDHSNTTVSVIIDLNSSIPSGEFGSWPLLTYVYIGDLVTSIGGYAFSYCSNLETVIIGENVKKIGGSAFISCTKLLNITIPSSVTLIGGSAFFNCSRLETVILGESIKEIEDSAFAFCSNLKCIYFYGISEPSIGQNAFSNVSAPVIVLIEYKDKFLGSLAVSNDTTVDGCAPMPTLPFTQSNTFSTSNTFAASLRGDISQTFSFTLTVTLSVSYSLTYSALGTQTLSYYLSNSMITYVETNFIYYSYTVIVYSTYYSYYSNFFTYVYLSPSDASGGMTTAALIGIICGAVAFVLIVVAAVTFLVKSNNRKEKSSVKLQFKETTTSTTKQYDDVDSIVEELAKEDEDNWI